jgi:hypothetical protein
MLTPSAGARAVADAFDSGNPVVWHPELKWLFCVMPYTISMGNYVSRWVSCGYFELLYPLSQTHCIGVKFLAFPLLLAEDNWLLAQQDQGAHLCALHILTSCENMAQRLRTEIEPEGLEIARRFFETHPMHVPNDIWLCALSARQ